jgi:hypothetical protein
MPATQRQMIGFLPARGIGDEGRTGDKRSCANTFVLWLCPLEFISDSDGTRSATLTRLCSEVSELSSR